MLALLERQEQFARDNPGDGPPLGTGIRSIMLAACISRTPDVALPDVPGSRGDSSSRPKQTPVTGPSKRPGCTAFRSFDRTSATRRPQTT